MTEYCNRLFHSLIDRGNGLALSDLTCLNCEFHNCALSLTTAIQKRSVISNARFQNCQISASCIGPAILKNVEIDGLITDSLLILWGTVFDQVTFSGRIGKIKINCHVHHVDISERTQRPFDEFRDKFYQNVEWALDISRAKFRLLEITGIPAHLIRRDPATQMVVTRERALAPAWRSRLRPANRLWPFAIDSFLATGEPDRVLVAPRTGPKHQVDKLLGELQELRDLGVIE